METGGRKNFSYREKLVHSEETEGFKIWDLMDKQIQFMQSLLEEGKEIILDS